jgi:hypothetical protein
MTELGEVIHVGVSKISMHQKYEVFKKIFSSIHMCIQCLGHFSLLPPASSFTPRPLPLPPTPSLPGRNYFALISNFVEEIV